MVPGVGSLRMKRNQKSLKKTSYVESVRELSKEGRKTHLLANRTRRTPLNSNPRAYSTVFDNTSPPYAWLLTGWIVEERRMFSNNRLYRCYYDPLGRMYTCKWAMEKPFKVVEEYLNVDENSVAILLDN